MRFESDELQFGFLIDGSVKADYPKPVNADEGRSVPKLGMEPIRRAALVKATIAEIGQTGSLDVTVGQIARRAGMSTALAHHYFGGKDRIFLAAMRHILGEFGRSTRAAVGAETDPAARVRAIIRASFASENFDPSVIAAWLSFYVQAQHAPEARRLLRVYLRRLQSNLAHELAPLVGRRAACVAEGIGAMIDGVYIRQALRAPIDRDEAAALVLDYLDLALMRQGRS